MHEVRAEVPMAEMLAYAPDLRSITGGPWGVHAGAFARYEEVPAHLAQKCHRRRATRWEEAVLGAVSRSGGAEAAVHSVSGRRRWPLAVAQRS